MDIFRDLCEILKKKYISSQVTKGKDSAFLVIPNSKHTCNLRTMWLYTWTTLGSTIFLHYSFDMVENLKSILKASLEEL